MFRLDMSHSIGRSFISFYFSWLFIDRITYLWPRLPCLCPMRRQTVRKPWVLFCETLSQEWYGPYLVTQWVVAWFNVLWRHLTAQIRTAHQPQSRLASQSGVWKLCFGTVLPRSFPIGGIAKLIGMDDLSYRIMPMVPWPRLVIVLESIVDSR